MEIEEQLREEIAQEFVDLRGVEFGSDVYKVGIDGITKLMDRAIEMEKLAREAEEKEKARKFDEDLKLKQFEEQAGYHKADTDLKLKQFEEQAGYHKADTDLKLKQLDEQIASRKIETDIKLDQLEEDQKDRLIKNCLGLAGIIVPAAITIWGTYKSIKFEETGTITTIMGRGFINKLLPKK